MRALFLTVTVGCSQVFGLEAPQRADGPLDARLDALPGDGTRGSCIERWSAPVFAGSPVLLGFSSPVVDDADPFVTADELSLIYVSGGMVYVATRSSRNDAFVDPMLQDVPAVMIGKSYVRADGLEAFVSAQGLVGSTDLFHATRKTTSDTWAAFDQSYLGNVNSSMPDDDPWLTPDLFHLYLSTGDGRQHIVMSARLSSQSAFGSPQPLAALSSSAAEYDPTLTPDERVIVFSSTRGNGRELWYATRASASAAFGTPQRVPLGVAINAQDPHISNDGCDLYFASASGSSNNLDLYVVSMQ